MVARGFREAWSTSSVIVKAGIIGAGLIVLVIIVLSTKSYIANRSFEKREAARAAEREQLEAEKAQLQAEKLKALTEAADANARADTYRTVAESKRADKVQTIKELEAIEAEHTKHKAEAEQRGDSLSDAELRDELCRRLAARGYKACN